MFGVNFTRQMWWAWLFMALTFVAMTVPNLLGSEGSVVEKLVGLLGDIVLPGVLIFSVCLVRSPNRSQHDVSENARPLSIWGNFWRAYVAGLGSMLLFLAFGFVFPGVFDGQYSVAENLLWFVAGLPFNLLSAWLFFSRDRRGQAKYLFTALRGF
jgi:hypothetical protein